MKRALAAENSEAAEWAEAEPAISAPSEPKVSRHETPSLMRLGGGSNGIHDASTA
jgi:hypothetical protein